jgi:hypothetical protein
MSYRVTTTLYAMNKMMMKCFNHSLLNLLTGYDCMYLRAECITCTECHSRIIPILLCASIMPRRSSVCINVKLIRQVLGHENRLIHKTTKGCGVLDISYSMLTTIEIVFPRCVFKSNNKTFFGIIY